MNKVFYIYGAMDTKTNKLVSDLTRPNRKFWVTETACKNAIRNCKWKKYNLKCVKIKCEIEDEEQKE